MDGVPSTPGKFKTDKPYHQRRLLQRWVYNHHLTFWLLIALSLLAIVLLFSPRLSSPSISSRRHLSTSSHDPWGGPDWEKHVRASARVLRSSSHRSISVLVTGAAGFVGTHASLALKRRGDGVLGLDNFNDYYDTSLKRSRQALLDGEGVFVVEGDINDPDLLRKLFDVVPFTHVLHLAAQAGVRYALRDPASYVRSNVAGLVSVLEAARSASPRPAIVWASSSSVYGLNSKVPFSEPDRTDRPASLYAATKKAGEEIAHAYNHIYGLSITGLRFFTVYGPWGRPDMAYFFFTEDILRRKPISIYEGPNHTTVARDFTYIDDVVKGCLAALDTAKKSTGTGGSAQLRIYNLGGTTPVAVRELVGILERLLNVKAIQEVMEMPRNGDVQFTHANIGLAQRELGYRPSTDLETGLKKFVDWYLDYYSRSSSLAKKFSGIAGRFGFF
ncbi:putative UDP-glucuronate 4-epimerase [Dioscorea sansibarensis]